MHAQITPFYVVLNQNAKTDLVFYDDGGIDAFDNHPIDDPERSKSRSKKPC